MTETVEGRTPGVVTEAKEKTQDVLADAQKQVASMTHELGGEAVSQIRAQLDQRSTQAGEQVQAVGTALQSGVTQLQVEGQDLPAKIVADVARRTDDLGAYLKSAQADQILGDIEDFARRRPWVQLGLPRLQASWLRVSSRHRATADTQQQVAAVAIRSGAFPPEMCR
jgi:hypothetical protein